MTFHTNLDLRTKASEVLSKGRCPTRKEEREYILLSSLRYELRTLGSGEIIEVPRGFVTDLASVPRALWGLVGPSGSHAAAAVVHDFLYRDANMRRRYSRKEADAIFLEAMGVSCTPALRARVMWLAVRSPAGALAYRRNKAKPPTYSRV